jgi:hypothetical protein
MTQFDAVGRFFMNSIVPADDVRLFVYLRFVSECRAPTIVEIARAFDASVRQIRNVLETLAEDHILVLDPDPREIQMAMPFSAGSTV